MRKEIFKCDNCSRIMDRDKEHYCYHIQEHNLPGWASIDYSMGDDTNWHICQECFKKSGLKNKKVG